MRVQLQLYSLYTHTRTLAHIIINTNIFKLCSLRNPCRVLCIFIYKSQVVFHIISTSSGYIWAFVNLSRTCVCICTPIIDLWFVYSALPSLLFINQVRVVSREWYRRDITSDSSLWLLFYYSYIRMSYILYVCTCGFDTSPLIVNFSLFQRLIIQILFGTSWLQKYTWMPSFIKYYVIINRAHSCIIYKKRCISNEQKRSNIVQ